jgi:hypothetical protein
MVSSGVCVTVSRYIIVLALRERKYVWDERLARRLEKVKVLVTTFEGRLDVCKVWLQ